MTLILLLITIYLQTRMKTFIKAKLKKSDRQTNIDKCTKWLHMNITKFKRKSIFVSS